MPGTAGRVPAPPSTVSGGQTPAVALPAIAEHRWASTPLGAPESWDPALRVIADLVLSSPVPMALALGDELRLVYNDSYAQLIGTQHPAAAGRPAPEVLAEVWQLPGVGDMIERAYRTGESFLE